MKRERNEPMILHAYRVVLRIILLRLVRSLLVWALIAAAVLWWAFTGGQRWR